jgi:hypothetical protein
MSKAPNVPAGAIGLTWVNPDTGLVGKLIARRQGVPYSHAVVSLGRGEILDQPWKWTRIRSQEEWEQDRIIDWWIPTKPFTTSEIRRLRSIAHFIDGRIQYSWRSIAGFLIKGQGSYKRHHGLFCSELVAEIYMTVRNQDFSNIEQPWNVDVRTLLSALQDERDFKRLHKLQ